MTIWPNPFLSYDGLSLLRKRHEIQAFPEQFYNNYLVTTNIIIFPLSWGQAVAASRKQGLPVVTS